MSTDGAFRDLLAILALRCRDKPECARSHTRIGDPPLSRWQTGNDVHKPVPTEHVGFLSSGLPLIDVSIARGRTPDQLRALIAALHLAAEESVGADPENITVIVREVERTHWSRTDTTIAERDAAASAENDT